MIPRPFAFLAVAACTIGVLLGLELFLRVAGYQAREPYGPDPVLGWTLRPGVTGWFGKEGGALVSVNAAGRRDEHVPMGKPDNVYRIAVLGDSYSEAFQVEREQAYWALLPRLLQQCGFQPGRRFQVLNFGVSGYGTGHQYLTLVSRAFLYQPDLVML